MTAEFIFDRQQELRAVRDLLQKRRTVLIHGPAGVGKSLLLRAVLPEFPDVLYCPNSATLRNVLRGLATSLIHCGPAHSKRFCGAGGIDVVNAQSAVNLKGIVLDELRRDRLLVVLDHITRPPAAFAAAMREITGWASTPIIVVARSPHMEDVGSLHSFFPDRRDRLAIGKFDHETAGDFAREVIHRSGLSADNKEELVARVIQMSRGNPGAILAMLEMAKNPKYRSADRIKLTPLYIDFRLKTTS